MVHSWMSHDYKEVTNVALTPVQSPSSATNIALQTVRVIFQYSLVIYSNPVVISCLWVVWYQSHSNEVAGTAARGDEVWSRDLSHGIHGFHPQGNVRGMGRPSLQLGQPAGELLKGQRSIHVHACIGCKK